MATRVYLDHNATAPLRAEVQELWQRLTTSVHGNPSSLHASGRAARALVDDARAQVAAALEVAEEEIFFTSGATESNNLALQGVLEAHRARTGRPGTLVTLATEHPSILEPARSLAAQGHHLELVGVDREGFPRREHLARALALPEPTLVSISAANGENGVAYGVEELAMEVRALRSPPVFHTDAVQALGRRPLDLGAMDLASFSAHKIGGPLGVGILWKRSGAALSARFHGGGQEAALRPGTENAPAIAAAALAVELCVREREAYARHTSELTHLLWRCIQDAVPTARMVGPELDSSRRLSNTLCVLIPNTEGRVIVTRLDLEGVEVSAGSACASGSAEPSHVLKAMGYDDEEARSGLRLSVGRNTTHEDCKRVGMVFRKVFARGAASRGHSESSATRLRDC